VRRHCGRTVGIAVGLAMSSVDRHPAAEVIGLQDQQGNDDADRDRRSENAATR
jgi:hypothetical protein